MTQREIDREYYDSSDYFEGREAEHIVDVDSPFQRYRLRKVLDIHRPLADARVVDLGCGWGTFSFALAERGLEVVGVDFSRRSIELCEVRQKERDLPGLSFLCADAGDTGLTGGAWDVVVAADLFEHLYPDDSTRVAREAFRLLKPGGRFSTWTPHRGHVLEILKNNEILLSRDVTHVDYKSMGRMRGLLEDAGFQIEKAYYAESHVPGLRTVERLLQGWVPMLRRRIAVLGRKPFEKAEASADHGAPEPTT